MKLSELLFHVNEASTWKKPDRFKPLIELAKTNDTRIPTLFFHMSSYDRIGINPKSNFTTPLGIYAYPLTTTFLEQLMKHNLPFAGERSWIHVFKPKPRSEL